MGTSFCVLSLQHPAEQRWRFCADSVSCRSSPFLSLLPTSLHSLALSAGLRKVCSIAHSHSLSSGNSQFIRLWTSTCFKHFRSQRYRHRPWTPGVAIPHVNIKRMVFKHQRCEPPQQELRPFSSPQHLHLQSLRRGTHKQEHQIGRECLFSAIVLFLV